MSEANNKYYFKPSGNAIKDFNGVVNQIGTYNGYMEKNYKKMDDLLKQSEAIYILSYLSQKNDFQELTDENKVEESIKDDYFIENGTDVLDEITENNITKWKSFLNTVPDDFKKLANDLNGVHQGRINANEVNCFENDNVKKLLDEITPKEKSKTLDTSEKTSDDFDNDIKYEQEFKMSDDFVKDFNQMVFHLNEHGSELKLEVKNDYHLFQVVSYLSQIKSHEFEMITDVNKIDDFIKFGNNNKESDEKTKNNIAKWKKFLNTVNKAKAQPNFLKGCKELNKMTHETASIEGKKNYVNPIKTFFSWLFSETKDSFTNYFKRENGKAKEEYINSKLESNKSAYKEKKESLVRPLSKILFEAKQKAKEEENEQKSTGENVQV